MPDFKLLDAYTEEEIEEYLFQKKEQEEDIKQIEEIDSPEDIDRFNKTRLNIVKEQNSKKTIPSNRYCGACGSIIPTTKIVVEKLKEVKNK